MNFDRYNNAIEQTGLQNESLKPIKLETERLRILRSQMGNRKLLIFFDNGIKDHQRLLSYYQMSDCQELAAMDPYLFFDLPYNKLKTILTSNDLAILHNFIDDYLITNLKSSKSPEEKECDYFEKNFIYPI